MNAIPLAVAFNNFMSDRNGVDVDLVVIHTMVGNISRFSRILMWVSRILGRGEDQIIGFSLKTARDGAWDAAGRLAAMTPEQWRDLHLIHCAHHLSFLIPK